MSTNAAPTPSREALDGEALRAKYADACELIDWLQAERTRLEGERDRLERIRVAAQRFHDAELVWVYHQSDKASWRAAHDAGTELRAALASVPPLRHEGAADAGD
jgi:hypothetical protein